MPAIRDLGLHLEGAARLRRLYQVWPLSRGMPARAGGAPLSPRDLILDLRQWVDTATGGSRCWTASRGPTAPDRSRKVRGQDRGRRDRRRHAVVLHDVHALRGRLPCGHRACATIVQLRRSLVDEGPLTRPSKAHFRTWQPKATLREVARMRARWTRELDFEIPRPQTAVKYLWFSVTSPVSTSGCRRIHGSRQDSSRRRRGLRLLYESEHNSGNDVRRPARKPVRDARRAQYRALQGHSSRDLHYRPAHAQRLSNEYPRWARGTRSGTTPNCWLSCWRAVRSASASGLPVTYHDPCYLARYNGVLDAPRRIVRALGCELVEMPRNGADTFCCGAVEPDLMTTASSPSGRRERIAEARLTWTVRGRVPQGCHHVLRRRQDNASRRPTQRPGHHRLDR